MIKRIILLSMLLAGIQTAQAVTVTSGCTFAWDYPTASLPFVDGFRIYLDNAAKLDVPSTQQTGTCAALGVTTGQHSAEVTAFNAVGESARSNLVPFVFVVTAPGSPTNLRRQ